MSAVRDRDGVTHVVVIEPGPSWAGYAACYIRFWTRRLGTPGVFVIGQDERMDETEDNVDCMTCLVNSVYDQA